MRNLYLCCLAAAALLALPAYGQDDSQSLGDVARQARSQKQKDAPAKTAQEKSAQDQSGQGQAPDKQAPDKTAAAKTKQSSKASKVITNEDISSRAASTPQNSDQAKPVETSAQQPESWKAQPEEWKNQIAQMKSSIAEMKAQIDQLNDSIHYTSGNCVAGCAAWNERQQGKQQQVETMKAQLEDQQKRLEAMQEAARQQGYGSSVYDP
jgi:chromosome segregation ATPase